MKRRDQEIGRIGRNPRAEGVASSRGGSGTDAGPKIELSRRQSMAIFYCSIGRAIQAGGLEAGFWTG